MNRFPACGVVFALIVCIAVLFVCIPSVLAQTTTTGGLTGTITDPSGGVVVGAAVTLTSNATGQSRTAATDSAGAFTFSLLSPGTYSVKISATGFKTVEVPSVTVNVSTTPVLNEKLEVGAQSTEITVESTVETIQTQNVTNGQLVGARTVTDLPLSTRNYTQIINLSPGVVVNVASAGLLGAGTQDINVNGSGSDQNNYQMDGASITNYGSGGGAQSGNYPGIGIPNPDAIQEFKIQTSQYDAAYGQNPGANVNVVTKSGTNQFHGDVWEFNRNNFFNANDYFLGASQREFGQPNTPPTLKQNQFGGTLGGPVLKDKIFFFGSYQGTRQINGVGTNGIAHGVTSVALLPWDDPSSPSDPRHLSDPAAYKAYLGSVFGGLFGTIPAFSTVAPDGSNISDAAVAVLQAKSPFGSPIYNHGFYMPSAPAGCALPCQTTIVDPIVANEDQYVGNGDYVISTKNTVSSKFFYAKDPQTQTFVCFGGCNPGAPEQANYSTTSALLKLTSVLTSNLVNEARFSFQRQVTDSHDDVPIKACDVGITPLINGNTGVQIPCPTVPTKFTELTLLPVFGTLGLADQCWNGAAPGPAGCSVNPGGGPSSFSTFGAPWTMGGNFFSASTNVFNTFQPSDQISWNHGKHSIRAGVEVQRIQWNWTLQGPARGDLNFGNEADFLTSGSVPFYSGMIFQFTTRLSGDNPNLHYLRVNEFSSYVADDIKVNSKLTLNLGLRWEYDGLPTDTTTLFTNFWSSQANVVNTGSFFLGNTASAANCPAFPCATGANNVGTLAGFVVQSNYHSIYGVTAPAGIYPGYPGGATGVIFNNGKTLTQGSPIANFAPRIGLAWQPLGDKFVVRAAYGIFYDRIYGNLLGNNQQGNPPYAGAVVNNLIGGTNSLAEPFPAGTLGWIPRTLGIVNGTAAAGAIDLAALNGSTGLTNNSTSDAQDMGTPLIQQYSLDLQYEFKHNWVVDVAYIGTHGTHLYDWARSVNDARLVDCGSASATCNPPTEPQNIAMQMPGSSFAFNDPGNTNPASQVKYNTSPNAALGTNGNAIARVPILGLDPSGGSLTSTEGDHKYNSLQAQLRHQFSHGLLFQASYTWSKLLTNINASTSGGGISAPGNVLSGGATSNDPLNLGQQYGPAAFNRSQRLVLSYSYDLPFKGEGWKGKAVNGWTISGVTTAQNGVPFTIVDGTGGSLYTGMTNDFGAPSRAELASPTSCDKFGNCNSTVAIATPGSNKSRLGGSFGGPGWINAGAFGATPQFGGYPNPAWVAGDGQTGCSVGTPAAPLTPQFNQCGTGWGNSKIGSILGPGQWNWDAAIIKNTQITERFNLQFRTEFFNLWNHTQFNPPVVNNVTAGGFGQITSTSVPGRVLQFGLKLLF
jgi:Carboxypeptidase regulatory-like domain